MLRLQHTCSRSAVGRASLARGQWTLGLQLQSSRAPAIRHRKPARLCRLRAGQDSRSAEYQIKQQVLDLERERDEALERGRAAAEQVTRMLDASQRLLAQAKLLIDSGDEKAAREYLEDKAQVQETLEKAQDRAEANFQLAARLDDNAGQKQEELVNLISAAEPRTMRASDSSPGPSKSYRSEPWSPAAPDPPATPAARPSELARASSKDFERSFLDMERASLERLIQAGTDSRRVHVPSSSKPAASSATPDWWSQGETAMQTHLQQHAQEHSTTEQAAEAAAESAKMVLSRAARNRSSTPEDIPMLLHWARTARAAGVTIALPAALDMGTRRELLRVFALTCLTARQNRGALLGYAPTSVPALHAFSSSPLSSVGAQALVVAAAYMLQLPSEAAISSINEALNGRVCSLLVDAATASPEDGTTLARQARVSAKQLQQVLATFPPKLASRAMKQLQEQVDHHSLLRTHWREAFGALYARCDGQLATTRLLFTILRLDDLD